MVETAKKTKKTESDRTPEEIAATIRLMDAEALKFQAQAREADTEAHKAEVEARFGEENIAHINSMRLGQEVQTRAMLRVEQEQLAHPRYHNIYHYTQGVDARSVRECMQQIDIWHRIDNTAPFEIVFSSPGGSVIDGMALYDYIQQMRNDGHIVTTSTIGMAASMAGILLQAGDIRAMGKEAYLLIHQVSFGAYGSFGQVEDEVEFVKKIQERILNIFAARSTMSRADIAKNWKRKDWWLDSDEAMKAGFVDAIR